MNKDIEEYKKFQRRIFILGAGKAFFSFLLIGKLYHLQILNKLKFGRLSETNRIKVKILYPERGVIFDSFGQKIAENRIDYQITFLKEKKNKLQSNIKDLKKIINISEEDLLHFKKNIKRETLDDFVTIKKNLNWNELEIFEYFSHHFPFLNIKKEKVRSYRNNYAFSHVVGYVGYESRKKQSIKAPELKIGKTGIEKVYDKTLIGSQGWQKIESNSSGKIIRKLETSKSMSGRNLKTHLVADIQEFAYQKLDGKSGSIVILDCLNGGVLGLVSSPSFDINEFSYGVKSSTWRSLQSDLLNPLLNKPISGLYSPGSTFKLVVAMAILEKPDFKVEKNFFCSGFVDLGNHRFHCWKRKGHGSVDLNRAIKESCDCYFYSLANEINIDNLARVANKFGFGTKTKIDLPNESNGLMPDQNWKKKNKNDSWHLGETYNAVIGQGFTLSTPLQIATMTARIASGKEIIPTIKQKLSHNFDTLNYNEKSFEIIRNTMYQVVNEYKGTAFSSKLKNKHYKMAGKTGTSQVRRISISERESGVLENKELPYKLRDHSIFTGYAPFDNPKYAIATVIEHHGSGSKVAAPISRDIMDFTLSLLG